MEINLAKYKNFVVSDPEFFEQAYVSLIQEAVVMGEEKDIKNEDIGKVHKTVLGTTSILLDSGVLRGVEAVRILLAFDGLNEEDKERLYNNMIYAAFLFCTYGVKNDNGKVTVSSYGLDMFMKAYGSFRDKRMFKKILREYDVDEAEAIFTDSIIAIIRDTFMDVIPDDIEVRISRHKYEDLVSGDRFICPEFIRFILECPELAIDSCQGYIRNLKAMIDTYRMDMDYAETDEIREILQFNIDCSIYTHKMYGVLLSVTQRFLNGEFMEAEEVLACLEAELKALGEMDICIPKALEGTIKEYVEAKPEN